MKFYEKIFLLLVSLTIVSCGTQKAIVNPSSMEDIAANADMAYKKRVVANRLSASALTARLNVNLQYGGRSVSCGGQLRMKRGEVIQISLTLPLIGTEVGRLECTPSGVLLVDRMNKQYVRASYGQMEFLAQAGLDFFTLQSLFWNELFVPGEEGKDVNINLERFRASVSGDYTLLTLADAPKLEYDFLTQTSTARLERVTVRSRRVADKGEMICRYSAFTEVSGKPFPANINLDIKDLGRDLGLSMSLNRIGNAADWETHTTVSAKYKQRTPEEILGQLVRLAN